MKKRIFYTEIAYILGLLLLGLGTAFMVRADFGVSMVVAPAYILHLVLSKIFPIFSFGMATYAFQALLLIVLSLILRKFKPKFLFSFCTAVIYGFILDGMTVLVSLLPDNGGLARFFLYVFGMLLVSVSISLLFRSYIPPEAYEVFVMEISDRFHFDVHKVKTAYDCISCLLGIVMSFAFFGLWHFEGVSWGTIVCALVNGTVIGFFSKLFDKGFIFKDRFPLRKRLNQMEAVE